MIDKVEATYAEKSGSNWVVDEDDYNELYEAYEKLLLKDNQIAEMINELRLKAINYHNHESLRERLRATVLKYVTRRDDDVRIN